MASANEPGELRMVCERSDGRTKIAWSGRTDGSINAGKSPDGVLANLTYDKHVFVPFIGPRLKGGDIVRLFVKLDAADGLDASDGIIIVPIWMDGLFKELNAADFGHTTDFPAATLAGIWIEMGSGYQIPQGIKSARLGNGRMVISVEDDA